MKMTVKRPRRRVRKDPWIDPSAQSDPYYRPTIYYFSVIDCSCENGVGTDTWNDYATYTIRLYAKLLDKSSKFILTKF